MLKDESCHFEHADAIFSIKDLAQRFVGTNECFIVWILELVRADVLPDLACNVRARERFRADNDSQFLIGLDRLQKCRTRRPLAFNNRGICHAPT